MNKFNDTAQGKEEFTRAVSELLKREPRSGVEEIKYFSKNYSEFVEITYKNGYVARICVNYNSNGAIFKEIAREVYGEGAYGKVEM